MVFSSAPGTKALIKPLDLIASLQDILEAEERAQGSHTKASSKIKNVETLDQVPCFVLFCF